MFDGLAKPPAGGAMPARPSARPLAIDLCCGLGGWAEGLLAEGYAVIGFDIVRYVYGEHRYPAQLVVQDVLTLHGSQFRTAALIVASPPCTEFSYMAMPWTRGKQIARALRGKDEFPAGYTGSRTQAELTALFDACFRIQREASEAAGHRIPLVVENVRGAQEWVGRATWNFGSFFLWGDVPALMPSATRAAKVPGPDWSRHGEPGYRGQEFNTPADQRLRIAAGLKAPGAPHIRDGATHTRRLTNPAERDGVKHHGSGAIWFDTGPASLPSSSPRRKFASAMIAKIPLPLARHIARTFLPDAGRATPALVGALFDN